MSTFGFVKIATGSTPVNLTDSASVKMMTALSTHLAIPCHLALCDWQLNDSRKALRTEGLSAVVQLPIAQGEMTGDSQMGTQRCHHFHRSGVCQIHGSGACRNFHKAKSAHFV